jgi:hypothetical protein
MPGGGEDDEFGASVAVWRLAVRWVSQPDVTSLRSHTRASRDRR